MTRVSFLILGLCILVSEFGQAEMTKVEFTKSMDEKMPKKICDTMTKSGHNPLRECFSFSGETCINALKPLVHQCSSDALPSMPLTLKGTGDKNTDPGGHWAVVIAICTEKKLMSQFAEKRAKTKMCDGWAADTARR